MSTAIGFSSQALPKFCLISALTLFSYSKNISSCAQLPAPNQTELTRPNDDLSGRLNTALQTRESGDPLAIAQASERVLALALVQMAKIRMDAKAFAEAADLCRQSLEFEDSPQTRVELAIVSFYAGKTEDAIQQASTAAEMNPANNLAWTIKGEALLRNNDYEGSVTALLRALDLRHNAEPSYSLGMAYLGLGQLQQARDAFSQVLALTGDAGWARVLIGRAYEEQKFPVEAVGEFKTALQLDPHTPNAHYYWARTLLKQNDWSPTPEVRSQLQEELTVNPRHFLANYLLGIFESIERNYDASDRYLHLTSKLNPTLPEAWMYLGLNANAREDKQSAERYFRRAIELREKGDDPAKHLSIRRAYIALGRILLSSGRKVEGERFLSLARKMQLEDLTERQEKMATIKSKEGVGVAGAVASDLSGVDSGTTRAFGPDDGTIGPSAFIHKRLTPALAPPTRVGDAEVRLRAVLGSSFNDLATADAVQGEYESALKHYLSASAWDPKIPGLKRNLALAYFYAGQPAKAIPLLERVVGQTPQDLQARATLAQSYFSNKNFAKAVQTLSPLSAQVDQDPQMAFVWAKSLAEIGRKREALSVLKRLENSDSEFSVKSLLDRANLLKELGESELAAKCFRRVLTIDPTNHDANCALHLSSCSGAISEQ